MRCRHLPALVLAAAALLAASPARAEDGLLAGYLREVVAKNPTLRARVHQRLASTEEAQASGRWPDPRLSIMVDRLPSDPMTSQTMPPMIQYGVQQMVPWPGKLGFMREAAEAQAAAAGSDVDVRRLDLALEAKRAYWMLALVVRRRAIVQAERALAATLADATLGRYGTGVGGHHDVARAQVEVAALDVQLVDLDGERASAIAMINALRDAPIDAPFADPRPASTPAPRLDRAQLTDRALAQRPELRGMRAMQGGMIAMAALERRERWPDPMVGLWYNQMIGMPDSGGAMIGATVPLFGIGRQNHRAAALDAKAEAALEDQAAMRLMIRFEVTDAIVAVETATRQVDLVKTVAMPRARESFQASLASFGAGTADVVAVLDARRSLQTAELVLADAEIRRELAIARLERVVGGSIGPERQSNGGAP